MNAVQILVEAQGKLRFIDPDDMPGKPLAKPVGSLDDFVIALYRAEDDAMRYYFVMDDQTAIAGVILRGVADKPFAAPTAYQVEYAAVTPAHRGHGVMRRLYRWLRDQSVVLVPGKEQSPEAQAMWQSLT